VDALLSELGIDLPIIQAPIAGVSTPEMAAAVSNAGGLGSVAVGSIDADTTRQMIADVRARTNRPFNVSVFCHPPARADAARETASFTRLGPEFARYGANPPGRLTEIYKSFLTDDAKLAVLLTERPTIVSFHFGLPSLDRIQALRAAGIVLLATATNLEEGKAIAAAGIDAGKALHTAAKSAGEYGYGAQWAGQGGPLARTVPVAELVACLRSEMEQALLGWACS
jgi:nitronate monooxygenase